MSDFMNSKKKLALVESVWKMYVELWEVYKPFKFEWELLLMICEDLSKIEWIKEMSDYDFKCTISDNLNDEYVETFKEYYDLSNDAECSLVDEWFTFCMWLFYEKEETDDLINIVVEQKISYDNADNKYTYWLMMKELFEIVYWEYDDKNNKNLNLDDIKDQLKTLYNN